MKFSPIGLIVSLMAPTLKEIVVTLGEQLYGHQLFLMFKVKALWTLFHCLVLYQERFSFASDNHSHSLFGMIIILIQNTNKNHSHLEFK